MTSSIFLDFCLAECCKISIAVNLRTANAYAIKLNTLTEQINLNNLELKNWLGDVSYTCYDVIKDSKFPVCKMYYLVCKMRNLVCILQKLHEFNSHFLEVMFTCWKNSLGTTETASTKFWIFKKITPCSELSYPRKNNQNFQKIILEF